MTLHREEASLGASSEYKAKGRITLVADVDDIEMWEKIVVKIDGLRIYESENFREQMVSMLQEDSHLLKDELEHLKRDRNNIEQHMKQELNNETIKNNRLEQELHKTVQQLRAAEKELERLRDLDKQLVELGKLIAKPPGCPSDPNG